MPFTFREIGLEKLEFSRCYAYVLECADGSLYIGSTRKLKNRVMQHKNGEGAIHTRKRLPVRLVYYECFDRIDYAFAREHQIKRWSRTKKIALIVEDYDQMRYFSQRPEERCPRVPRAPQDY